MGQELFKTHMGVGYRNENEAYNVQRMKHYKNRLNTYFTHFREWENFSFPEWSGHVQVNKGELEIRL